MQRAFGLKVGVVTACLAVVAGCSADAERCYPVRGTVVYDDGSPAKELAGGSVTFLPPAGTPVASGTIGDDGSFVLSSRKEGDGAVAGKHQATIEMPTPESGGDAPKRAAVKAVIDPDSASQEVTVEPKSNDITLKVRRAAPRRGPTKS